MENLPNEIGNGENTPANYIKSPLKAIRQQCLWCMCDSANEVRLCPSTDCPLYPFRFGKNPNMKREYTDEQKAEMVERLRRNKNEQP